MQGGVLQYCLVWRVRVLVAADLECPPVLGSRSPPSSPRVGAQLSEILLAEVLEGVPIPPYPLVNQNDSAPLTPGKETHPPRKNEQGAHHRERKETRRDGLVETLWF